MSHAPSEKYKMFRNFMMNELGISKDDIKSWTKEAAHQAAKQALAEIDVEQLARQAISSAITGNNFYRNGMSKDFKEIAAKIIQEELAGKISLSVRNEGS